MKNLICILTVAAAILSSYPSFSQSLSAGVFSGINVSDIHGNGISGKWKYKAGASTGVYADYSFWQVFGVKTGLNFSSVYYEHKLYDQAYPPGPMPYFPAYSSYYDPRFSSMYLPRPERMDFSFLTFPLQVRISIPSEPRLDLSGGMFYSVVNNNSVDNYYYVALEPADDDFGYTWSAALSYQLPGDFRVSLGTSYFTGRKEFLDYGSYRHGYVDFTMGVAYTGFLKKKQKELPQFIAADTLPSVLSVTYFGGVNINRNSCEYYSEKYSLSTGMSAGFKLNVRWAQKSSFQTGISFERKGYSLKDSSSVYYRYVKEGEPQYQVDTRIGIDYIVIPALLNFYLGREGKMYINSGPYMGFKLNARVTGEAYNEERTSSEYRSVMKIVYDDIDAIIKDMDVGWMAGGGVLIPLKGNYSIDLGVRYSMGFTDLLDRSYFSDYYAVDTYKSVMKNSTLSIHAGITLPVNRRRGL